MPARALGKGRREVSVCDGLDSVWCPARPEGPGPGRRSGEQVLEDPVRLVDHPAVLAHAVTEKPLG